MFPANLSSAENDLPISTWLPPYPVIKLLLTNQDWLQHRVPGYAGTSGGFVVLLRPSGKGFFPEQ
eukprot:997655-Rhodomonas_salina.1